MKLGTSLLLSIVIFAVTVSSIAFVTIYYLNSIKSTSEQNANAIYEPLKGLNDISKSIEHLEEGTISNSKTSRPASLNSEELAEQLSELKLLKMQVNPDVGI